MNSNPAIRHLAVVLLAGALVCSPGLRAQEFSQEKAYEHLTYLAQTIGPRPLGSPQEKAALDYVAAKFAEIGGNVERQPVTGTGEAPGENPLNTLSFNVVGRFPGESPREIVVGAHIDSASPEIPGADDDGSGVAAMLEAARVLSARPHRATLVFVAFCGEEAGLVGSRSFVANYPLQNVALMVELDMTSGDSPLMLWIDAKDRQSPAWLVSASVDIFHELGYRDMDYPTIFQSLNSAIGGAGSDHEPFLEKDIPAIAFVSDIRHPIHTPFDNLGNFRPDGLARSGRLVVGLLEKFDAGQPAERAGHYALVMAIGRPIYVAPSWLAAFVVLSLVVGLAGLLRLYASRKTAIDGEREKKIKKSWPKLLGLHFLMLVTAFASFLLMGFLKGHRLPWVYRPGAYVLYAFLFFALGVWLSLQVVRVWRLRTSAFFYAVRASALFSVMIILAWTLSGPRLAVFPAAGLIAIGLAWIVRPAWLKTLLWIASPVAMFRLLVMPEYYQFIYRGVAGSGLIELKTAPAFILFNLAVLLFTLIWSQPFLLGFAAVYRSSGGDLFGLKPFRQPLSLVPVGVLIFAGGFYLCRTPSYAPPWSQSVIVLERAGGEAAGTAIEISSGDYLKGITADVAREGQNTRERSCCVKTRRGAGDGLAPRRRRFQARTEGRGQRVTGARFDFLFSRQPFNVSLRLWSDKPLRVKEANVHYAKGKKSAVLRWVQYPPPHLEPELMIALQEGASLEAEVTAVFLDLPLAIRCQGRDKSFVYRSQLTRRLHLAASPGPAH